MELVVVLSIAAVLATFSVALLGRSRDSFQRQNAARQFKNFLERARFDAVKRRANAASDLSKIRVLSQTSYSYAIDLNQNGVIDAAETVTVDLAPLGNVKIVSDLAYPVTISFDQRGSSSTVDASSVPVTPLFYFCDGVCTRSTATEKNSNIIYVSPTGTVAMMKGGTALPSFNNPSVTTVARDASVNPSLAVWDPDPNAPTPTPTPTPVDASPTPTPTATVTPTVTPTPTYCQAGQNASTGCTCLTPMWVRSNGKCR
jgi:Tfp pilus assembly protein FimT